MTFFNKNMDALYINLLLKINNNKYEIKLIRQNIN